MFCRSQRNAASRAIGKIVLGNPAKSRLLALRTSLTSKTRFRAVLRAELAPAQGPGLNAHWPTACHADIGLVQHKTSDDRDFSTQPYLPLLAAV